MYFIFVSFILMTTSVLVECRSREDYHEHKKFDCGNFRRELMSHMVSSRCKPHPTHVRLQPPDGYEFHPAVVVVNRCAGDCNYRACMPIAKDMVSVYVRKYVRGFPEKEEQCVVVRVPAHTECNCLCTVKASHCHSKQEYDSGSCSCRCKNQEMNRRECEAVPKMTWDDEMCSCRCGKTHTECMSGDVWNIDTCKCEGL